MSFGIRYFRYNFLDNCDYENVQFITLISFQLLSTNCTEITETSTLITLSCIHLI